MEVHVPDHPVMTYKQFFVHMAIVVLSLLIAIGLEQSVEALHHRKQRNELREALHRDLEKVEQDSEQMFRIGSHDDLELHFNMQTAMAAAQNHAPFHADYSRTGIDANPIEDPAFKAAKSSGLLSLLTQEEVRAYSEIDSIVENAGKIDQESFEQVGRVEYHKLRYGKAPLAPNGSWEKMSIDELNGYIRALGESHRGVEERLGENASAYLAARAILAGELDLEKIQVAERGEMPKRDYATPSPDQKMRLGLK